MTAFERPAILVKARLFTRPLGAKWPKPDGPQPWHTDGSRSSIVRKLEELSIRARLALLAASGEWLMSRLGETNEPAWDALLTAIWREIETPGSVDLETLPPPPSRNPKFDTVIAEYAHLVRSCIDIARKLDGALASYLESALRLVDYVMPDKAFSNWRLKSYARLAALSTGYTPKQVNDQILRQAKREKKPDYTIKKQIIATKGYDPLWGPIVSRAYTFGD